MSPHRFLKYINWTIAVVLIVFLVLVYWFVYRPGPKVSGSIEAPVTANVSIARDAFGVPHISAATVEDALFAQGFAMAQDRLWQMDAGRRLASGTLAEVVGVSALESDLDTRRMRLAHLAERQAAQLPPSDRAAIAAFSRGVNHFIETNRGRLPIEFTVLGYDPQPWTVADSLLLFLQMDRTLTSKWKRYLQKASMLAGGDPDKTNALYPERDGGEVQPGSNAWVVAGSRAASGKPILANDPHLEFSLPSVWYMNHLRAPGLNVSGVALVGTPGVMLGHNESIAWGTTNLEFAVQDLYVERLDPQTGKYLYNGKLEQAQLDREIVLVKGARPVELNVWITRHGPIVASEGNQAFALRWTTAEVGGGFPILDIDRARNWNDFLAACERFNGPGQNLVYADRQGNIGYHAVGRLPVRKYAAGVPVDGRSGNYEWDGYIPFSAMPAAYNPPSGLIVTANQNPFPEDYPYRVSGGFAPSYRSRQIRSLVEARKQWTAQDMLAVQSDVYSAFSDFLARQLTAAYDKIGKGNQSLAAPADVLRNWNGQMSRGSAAPMIVTLAYQHLRKAIAGRASSGKAPVYENAMAPSVIEKLLRERPASWFADWDQVLLRALSDGIAEGKRSQGPDAKLWDYGEYNRLYLVNPVGGSVKWFGQYFNIGPIPMSGSATTVKQTTQRLGPSMRMVIDLSDWDRSMQNIVTGESAHVFSPHYKDQWKAYYEGRSLPMQFEKVDASDTLTLRPR